ncbi:hypothetical protein HU200_005406 [Digitaria exilis]|uniref:DUF1618 domain-containing protein n=1 Tax=Digitaria exilis TaxID=1010633 RepID=A0A835FRX9_9POAL|nr:hypothetical protein HU200_005406 [Digitaria exilis]
MLNKYGIRADDTFFAEADTVASCPVFRGRHLRVSIGRAPPPASTFIYYNLQYSALGQDGYSSDISAAHVDSVLLEMRNQGAPFYLKDHFVYIAGAGQLPSVSLLPARDFLTKTEFVRDMEEGLVDPNGRILLDENTGILRRGDNDDGEFLVVWMDLRSHSEHGMANVCVLRSGSSQWEHNLLVPIVHEEGEDVVRSLSAAGMALPVGDRFLCWVGSRHSFILCDMADDVSSPKLRHVPLPWLPWDPDYYTDDLLPLTDPHTMGAAGSSAVRFVGIEPRCCCGGFGRCSCPKSRHAFTVTTWTLTLTMDEPIEWVKDTVMDCEELWALPGYEGIPRVHLQSPMVCLDDPDVVWFKVVSCEEKKEWMIQVDTRRKALLAASLVQGTASPWRSQSCDFRQAKLQ